MPQISFASDNFAGAHPEVMDALQRASTGHAPAYGDDEHTVAVQQSFREIFGSETGVYFVFGGTGANVLGLDSVCRPYDAVLCAETAHIHRDECGAPERFAGCKVIPIDTADGKLTPDLIEPLIRGHGDQHHPQPRVISISQPTELGTVYAVDELRDLADLAHRNGMLLHVDGARIANAIAALDADPREATFGAGVDVLSFGGTKNGMLFGEALLFRDSAQAADVPFRRKQAMQLASKMRFVSVQFAALLNDDLWLRSGAHANEMARRLANGVDGAPRLEITQLVQSNAVFARLPAERIARLQRDFRFYEWDSRTHEVRWMTAFDTTPADVDAFIAAIRRALG